MAPTATAPNFYEVLDVPFTASTEEIKRAYRSYVGANHPDKKSPHASDKSISEKYHQSQAAYKCLSSPTRRLIYDMRNFGKSSLGDDDTKTKLAQMQKEQSVIDIRNMNDSLEKIISRETTRGGVIIKNAWYGDLRLRQEKLEEGFAGKRTIVVSDLKGPVIDVVKPVQVLVEKSQIVLQGGVLTSKSDLPGFYNPASLDQDGMLELYVLYEFKSQLHEVIVGDRDMLCLPKRQHMVPKSDVPRGPFSTSNISPTPAMNAVAALEEAVNAYRFAALKPRCKGDATPREFVAVCCSIAAVAYVAWKKWLA